MWQHQPVKFGLFHITFIVLSAFFLALAIFFGYRFQEPERKKKRDLILTLSGLFLDTWEIGTIISKAILHIADWTLVPLQLCSTALLILPLPYFLKEGKIKDCVFGYLAFIRTAAGIAYFVNPTTIYNQPYIAESIHSGVYHRVIIATGTFTFFSQKRYTKKGLRSYFLGFPLFVAFSVRAVIGNTLALHFDPKTNVDYFFLRPKGPITIPILDTLVKPRVPFATYYFLYLACFFAIGFVPYGVFSLVNLIIAKAEERQNKVSA